MTRKMERVTVPTVLEQKLFGTKITREPWTAETVRQDLPDVKVSFQGKVLDARLCGRLNDYATVFVHGYAAPQWAFSWETIAYCLNEGTVLRG